MATQLYLDLPWTDQCGLLRHECTTPNVFDATTSKLCDSTPTALLLISTERLLDLERHLLTIVFSSILAILLDLERHLLPRGTLVALIAFLD